MKGKITFCLILIFSTVFHIDAQQNLTVSPAQLQSVLPVSPNAAALGKYGAIPVGHFTGVPDISIPIYEINTGQLKMPVSLSYHASGIKVEEIASWAGLGWTLNAGGAISRQTRGRPDEAINGFLTKYPLIRKFAQAQMTTIEAREYLEDVARGNIDAEPDIFFYNFPGGSGSMFTDTLGNFITMPVSKMQVSGSGGSWTIVTTDGTKYFFDHGETTESTPSTGEDVTPHGFFGVTYTSIYLSRIENAAGTDSIVFEYDPTYYSFTTHASQTRFIPMPDTCQGIDPPFTTVASTNTITGYRLKKIRFNNGEIRFKVKDTQRCDLPGEYALDEIVVKNTDSTFYRKYKFYHHNDGAALPCNPAYVESYRPYLDSLKSFDIANTVIETYGFGYNSSGLPKRTSYSQDHWGYFNNANNQATFYPSGLVLNPFTGTSQLIPGADRTTNPASSQAGMLNKITYPTGGSTYFEFENNTVLTTENFNNTMSNETIGIGYAFGTNYYQETFTLTHAVEVQLTISSSGCGGGYQTEDCPNINLSGPGGSYPLTVNATLYLQPGEYTVTVDLSSELISSEIRNNFWIQFSYPKIISNGSTTFLILAGGHRIKTIYDEDREGNVVNKRIFDYNRPDTAATSGQVLSLPSYMSEHYTVLPYQMTYIIRCHYATISSASNYPLLSTKGGYVMYSHVKEYSGDNGVNGVTEYTFTNHGDFNYGNFPFAPSTSHEWRRGQPLRQVIKRKVGSAYIPIEDRRYTYIETGYKSVDAIKSAGKNFYNGGFQYDSELYLVASGILLNDSVITTTYDEADANRTLVTIQTTGYSSSNYLPAHKKIINSKGKATQQYIRYPSDYATYTGNQPDAAAIQYLKDWNVIGIPVEIKTTQETQSGSHTATGGIYKKFKPYTFLEDTVFQLRVIPGNTDTDLSFINSNGMQKSSNYEPRISYPKYDTKTNLVQQKKIDDATSVYVWDYDKSYPIAEAINADSSSVAHTSFEADGKGGWTFSGSPSAHPSAPTGLKGYSLNAGSITRSGLSSGTTYLVTYWKRDSAGTITVNSGGGTNLLTRNGWVLYSHTISGATALTISGTAYIDELRLYPNGAMMKTYTYAPLRGITSECDANNRITYYEYDGFGRLRRIRDQDKNVIKVIDYQYKKSQAQ